MLLISAQQSLYLIPLKKNKAFIDGHEPSQQMA
jgi:hypothetical protein